ncbi:MAG: deoxyribodipyrimidine photo-lyase [Bacteroidales bacterium]
MNAVSLQKMAPERVFVASSLKYRLENDWVVYRMQASLRTRYNLALEEACRISIELQKPLKVIYHLNADFPEANYRHFNFLGQALAGISDTLSRHQIVFELVAGDFEAAMHEAGRKAVCLVTDRGYLRIHREQLRWLRENMECPVIEVEDNLVVPIESASPKAEWAARTLRPKINAKAGYFSQYAGLPSVLTPWPALVAADHRQNEQVLAQILQTVRQKHYLAPVALIGGEQTAAQLLNSFLSEKIAAYDSDRAIPARQGTSRLSAYLHFGMISPVEIYGKAALLPCAAAFLEQLLVRRELAHNFIYYTPRYDTFSAVPSWAALSLKKHASDPRPRVYPLSVLEEAGTHDPYWNAAMREMIQTGYMENTMRMYWGKKIIEWTETPEEAYLRILYLNNRYFLDGRDANSFAGVGWCFGLHDRPWQERPVFGMIRYMNETGLRRKQDMNLYIDRF